MNWRDLPISSSKCYNPRVDNDKNDNIKASVRSIILFIYLFYLILISLRIVCFHSVIPISVHLYSRLLIISPFCESFCLFSSPLSIPFDVFPLAAFVPLFPPLPPLPTPFSLLSLSSPFSLPPPRVPFSPLLLPPPHLGWSANDVSWVTYIFASSFIH